MDKWFQSRLGIQRWGYLGSKKTWKQTLLLRNDNIMMIRIQMQINFADKPEVGAFLVHVSSSGSGPP
jgi:hypothetical protein